MTSASAGVTELRALAYSQLGNKQDSKQAERISKLQHCQASLGPRDTHEERNETQNISTSHLFTPVITTCK
jgi:hypothetical protein